MSRPLPFLSLLALPVASIACGSDTEGLPPPAPMDAPSMDASVAVDTGVVLTPDAGLRARCPLPGNSPTCTSQSECGEVRPRSYCVDYCPEERDTRCPMGGRLDRCVAVCELGQCAAPEKLQSPLINVQFELGAIQSARSFVGIAVVGETSGGNPFGCADVESAPGRKFFDEAPMCYNIVEVRRGERVGTGSFFVPFRGLPSTPMVFVIYAFETDDDSTDPVGFACAEETLPAPGASVMDPIRVDAGRLARIDP